MLPGEPFRALSHEVHMRAITENLAGGADGIGDTLHTAHTSAAQRSSVHDERIELHFAVAIQKAAATRVKGLVIFHDDHSFLDGIERCPATFQHAPTRGHCIANAIEMGFDHVIGNGPGAAMNYKNGISQEESS